MTETNRRDFLKLLSAAAAGVVVGIPTISEAAPITEDPVRDLNLLKNILYMKDGEEWVGLCSVEQITVRAEITDVTPLGSATRKFLRPAPNIFEVCGLTDTTGIEAIKFLGNKSVYRDFKFISDHREITFSALFSQFSFSPMWTQPMFEVDLALNVRDGKIAISFDEIS